MPLPQGQSERRQDCIDHENAIDEIRANVERNSGKFTAMLWFLGVVGGGLVIMLSMILSKVSSVEALLTNGQITMAQHSEQIKSIKEVELPAIKKDIGEINDRHRYLDQNGVVKRVR